MMEDLVINSYKEQIKESLFRAKALDVAGFSVIIEELRRRSINTDRVVTFFHKIKLAGSKEDLDKITVEELEHIIEDINLQVTRALISSIEMSDTLIRKSRIIARDMSPDGKVGDDDKYVKVGVNLASEVTKHGIAAGLNTCIKNYCIQKLYQAKYKDKIREKEKELGIQEEDVPMKKNSTRIDTKKDKVMKEILGTVVQNNVDGNFGVVKNSYLEYLAGVVNDLESYK